MVYCRINCKLCSYWCILSTYTIAVHSSGVTRVGVTRGPNWRCHTYIFLKNLTTFFAHYCHFSWFHSGFSPLEGVTHPFFNLSDFVCPLFFVNSPTKFLFFVWVSPPGGCYPGRSASPSAHPLVTPMVHNTALNPSDNLSV